MPNSGLQVLQLLDEMVARGVEPHKRTYTPIITGLCNRVANEPKRGRAEHYLSKALDFLTLCISDLHDDIEESQAMDILRGCNSITTETEIAGHVVAEVLRLYMDQGVYGTFRLNFHRFDRFELDLRG